MKLWEKNISTSKEILKFTISNDQKLDLFLAPFDVLGSIAHVKMLSKVGLIEKNEEKYLIVELKKILIKIQNGNFTISKNNEDVHSQIEYLLTKKLGDAGRKIHTARSRNDQVLIDIKLFLRSEIEKLVFNVNELFKMFQSLSEKNKNFLLPGYTHFQVAMPSSFGLWFGSFAESLVDDLITIKSAFDVVNKNPLGSAAGYGSTFKIDRNLTSKLLGFTSLNYNSVYAQQTRGKTEKIISDALSNLSGTISKFCMDLVLFASQNFNFISLPEKFTTGSSIMPHKKNLDLFEIIRAKTNRIKSLSNSIEIITTNLPSGYHRDLQILKEILFPAFEELNNSISIILEIVPKIVINKNILNDEKYKYIFTVDEINNLVKKGIPFRNAYKKVSSQIQSNTYKTPKIENLKFGTHVGSIGNLANAEIKKEMSKVLKSFPFQKINSSIKNLLK